MSFDRIAKIYDATRWTEIPPHVMERILDSLQNLLKGCDRVLDIGIGTGRFAQFFKDAGFAVVGVDVSMSMMVQAREKGVRDVVRADAHHLPFRDGSFDASVMIHVLHLMRDWVQAVHEAGRVTGKIIVSEAGDVEGFSARQRYLELRNEYGYPLNRLNGGEFELRKFVPPKLVMSAGDYWTEFDADAEITDFETRKSSVMWDVPDDVHRRIMERLHAEYRGKKVRRHDIAEIVGWNPEDLRTFSR